MKKPNRKTTKLTLTAETIQQLTDETLLRQVVGGAISVNGDLCYGKTGTCSVQGPGCG